MNKEDIKGKLRNGVTTVVFTKKDGSERTMKCTLNESFIPQEQRPKEGSTHKVNDSVLAVFDIEKQGWRSFTITDVKSVQ
jgi:hypothetical protein